MGLLQIPFVITVETHLYQYNTIFCGWAYRSFPQFDYVHLAQMHLAPHRHSDSTKYNKIDL